MYGLNKCYNNITNNKGITVIHQTGIYDLFYSLKTFHSSYFAHVTIIHVPYTPRLLIVVIKYY